MVLRVYDRLLEPVFWIKALGIPGSLLILFFLLGCSRQVPSPEQVAEAFFTALNDRNYELASEFAEPHTKAFLRLVQRMADTQQKTGELLDLPGGGIVGSVQLLSENQALVLVERNRGSQQIPLIRIEGHWRVRLPESIF